MIIAVQGSRNFNDYSIFLRAMRTALSGMSEDDKEISIYSVGPVRVNAMSLEFSNVSERGLKARGIKINTRKVTPDWLESNMSNVDYFAFFSKPGERISDLVDVADNVGIDAGVYTFA